MLCDHQEGSGGLEGFDSDAEITRVSSLWFCSLCLVRLFLFMNYNSMCILGNLINMARCI